MLGKSLFATGSTALALVSLLACNPQPDTTLIRFQHRELAPLLPAIRKILPDNIEYENTDNELIIFANSDALSPYIATLNALDRAPAQYQFEWRPVSATHNSIRYSTQTTETPQGLLLTEDQVSYWQKSLKGNQTQGVQVQVHYLSNTESQLDIIQHRSDLQNQQTQKQRFTLHHGQWQPLNPAKMPAFSTRNTEPALEIRLLLLPQATP
jgi:hypothetical protein